MAFPTLLLSMLSVSGALQELGSLKVELAVVPDRQIVLYDALFLRVTITNSGKQPILLPGGACRSDASLVLWVTDMRTNADYPFRLDHCSSLTWSAAPLAPGASRVLHYSEHFAETLRVPPVSEAAQPFWRNLGDTIRIKARLRLDANMWLDAQQRERLKGPYGLSPYWVHLDAESPPIHVKPRPQQELARLFKPWGDEAVAKREPPSWQVPRRPTPKAFHALVPAGCDTPEELLTLERSLTPGTLRDTVHLFRLVTLIYADKDETRSRQTVDELLQWLDTLPEVERHCLAMAIAAWWRVARLPQPAWFELMYRLADRLPPHYQLQDYRHWHFRHCAEAVPTFALYLKEKGETYAWIEGYRKWLQEPRLPAKPAGPFPYGAPPSKLEPVKGPSTFDAQIQNPYRDGIGRPKARKEAPAPPLPLPSANPRRTDDARVPLPLACHSWQYFL